MKPFSALAAYLQQKPKLLSKYVAVGTKLAHYPAWVLTHFLEHLLLVQGLDPNSTPGEKLKEDLDACLNSGYEPAYDDNFDFGLVSRYLKDAHKRIPWNKLTLEEFSKLPDVSNLGDQVKEDIAVVVLDDNGEVSDKILKSKLPFAAQLALEELTEQGKNGNQGKPMDHPDIKNALKVLKEYASKLEKELDTSPPSKKKKKPAKRSKPRSKK